MKPFLFIFFLLTASPLHTLKQREESTQQLFTIFDWGSRKGRVYHHALAFSHTESCSIFNVQGSFVVEADNVPIKFPLKENMRPMGQQVNGDLLFLQDCYRNRKTTTSASKDFAKVLESKTNPDFYTLSCMQCFTSMLHSRSIGPSSEHTCA